MFPPNERESEEGDACFPLQARLVTPQPRRSLSRLPIHISLSLSNGSITIPHTQTSNKKMEGNFFTM